MNSGEIRGEPHFNVRMKPLLVAAAFLSLAELIAAYAVINTSGNVQLILAISVAVYPILLGAAAFHLLTFRGGVPLAPPRLSVHNDASRQARTPKEQGDFEDPYYLVAHSLFGILDAVKHELPPIIRQMPLPRPRTLCTESDVTVHDQSLGISSVRVTDSVQRITVGSLTRAEVSAKYRFLADEYKPGTTQRAIQQLSTSDPNYFFRIRSDGTIHSLLNLNELNPAVAHAHGEAIDFDTFMFLQVINMIHGQLIIAYSELEGLAFPSPRLTQFVKAVQQISIPLAETAIVLSDQGDLYGTLADVKARHRGTATI